MSVARAVAGVLAVSVVLGGCGTGVAGTGAPEGVEEGTEMELVAEVSAGSERKVAVASNAFGFDLLAEVDPAAGNTVTSPVSVAALLAMVLAGAGGDTAAAMAEVLHLDDPRDVRMGALLRALADTDDVTLSAANALWAAQDAQLRRDYVEFVTDTFGATLEEADLATRETADEIDTWVDDQTEGRITEIAQDLGLPSRDVMLVLLNAVYFLGEWTSEFNPERTREEPFTLPGGDTATVPMMRKHRQEFEYAARDGYGMLRLPYGEEGRYGMEILLPDPGSSLEELLTTVNADEWHAAAEALAPATVDELVLPRFELAWKLTLNDALRNLGMGAALTPGEAGFSPMSERELHLDTVVHKTYIRVDEKGTEAAAVTGGAMALSSAAKPGLVFRADRPFAFTVSDRETGAILFLGTVTDPRG